MSKNYLPTLHDKISYDIDEENRISSQSDKNEIENEIENLTENENVTENENIIENENETINDKEIKTPISIIKTEIKETTNQYLPLNNIYCSLHQTDYLKFDTNSFQIICTKCIEEGKENNLNFSNTTINIKKEKKTYDEETITCINHNDKKGSFYCDQCKEFICKFCFAEEHRMHKCHLPKIISDEFKTYINDSINNTEKLKPVLDNAIEEVSKIYSNLKVQKNDIIKVPSTSISNITFNNKNQINEFLNKFIILLDNLDNDVNTDYERHNRIKEKIQVYLKELDEISKKIINEDNSLNNFQLCIYHKKSKEKITEILNFITNSFNFLDNKLKSLIEKCETTKPNLLNDITLLNKSLSNYENTSMSSILTGQASNSILLRRFIRFIHSEIKFFKNTSIVIKSNSQIFLSGLSICGIYTSKKKRNDPNNINTNLLNRSSLDIQVNLFDYDIEKGIKGDNIFIEDFKIYEVTDRNDPSQIVNFSKGVKFYAEQNYLITIENISSNSYCDLWVGNIGSVSQNHQQKIKCHNTDTEFIFQETKGIQTDFDEFNSGIIEGILYSKY